MRAPSGLRLPPHVRRAVLDHAADSAPRECCGFVVGTPRRVVAAVPMENIATEATRRFRIADDAHIALRRELRRARPPLAILGVYHSHPSGVAWPSVSDVADAWYPEWFYVIAGLGGGRTRLRSFKIVSGRIWPVPS